MEVDRQWVEILIIDANYWDKEDWKVEDVDEPFSIDTKFFLL